MIHPRARSRTLVSIPLAILAALTAGCSGGPFTSPAGSGGGRTPQALPPASARPQADLGNPRVLAANLEVPWGIDFLPSGAALVTERDTTRVLRVTPQGRVGTAGTASAASKVSTVATIGAAEPRGEGGLLGIEIAPNFAESRWVYLYYTTAEDNRIVRFRYRNGRLSGKQVIVSGIPASSIHNGGRLVFGPDGMLYASTGESGNASLAQNLDSLGGKILRMTPTGKPAPGNPFRGSIVYSYGHRNIEGLAFGPDGRLYATEFGGNAWDEVNLIKAGNNYGWPEVEGFGAGAKYTEPLLTWRPSEASPSGAAIAGGSLWVAALRGTRLWRMPLSRDGSLGQPEALFTNEYGRLRTVIRSPRGALWVTTSNRDGRGDPGPRDDKILVLPLE